MISFDKKLIFIHLPKTGGYKVKKILGKHSPDTFTSGHDTLFGKGTGSRMWDNRTKVQVMHANVEFYEKTYTDVFDECTTFTVIRNPWDRMLSYIMWLNKGEFDREKFVNSLNFKIEGWFGGLYDVNQIPLLQNCEGKVKIDRIFRYENYKNELRQFFEERSIDTGEFLDTKLNSVSRKEHYSTFYDDEMIELVGRVCAPDIEHFGFTFENE